MIVNDLINKYSEWYYYVPVISAPGFRQGLSSKESTLNSCAGTPLIVPTASNSSMENFPGC
jgi:hypothetical protein